MWTKSFWAGTAERVIATFVQALIPLLVGVNLLEVDWQFAVSSAGGAALLALLKSLAAAGVNQKGVPSFVREAPPHDNEVL